jgi:hypothetical protein
MTASTMQPWFPFSFNFPSGDVDLANWFSPRIDVSYAGSPAIERDVVENVASFGDQLGTLIDAVVELAGERSGKELEDLRALKTKVDDVKARHKRDVKQSAKAAIERLAKLDKPALISMLRRYED